MSADEESVENDEEIVRVLEALNPVFERFTDEQVQLFEWHLRIRAYVMGAPPEWIEEGLFPPAFVLAALRQTIQESEKVGAARGEKREVSRSLAARVVDPASVAASRDADDGGG